MNIGQIFRIAPKSERTLIKRNGKILSYHLMNDFGSSCEYRVMSDVTGLEVGLIKYYGGRLLCCYEKEV